MTEVETFNALKFRRYASSDIVVGETHISAGSTYWVNNEGVLHRTDGPAYEYVDGGHGWYLNGKPHRTDGPAIEDVDGSRWWYLNGKLHRTDGPAVECANGSRWWYLNGDLQCNTG